MVDNSHRPRYGWIPLLLGGAALNVAAQLLPLGSGEERVREEHAATFCAAGLDVRHRVADQQAADALGKSRVLNAPPSADRTAYLRLQAAAWVFFTTYGLARFRLKSPLLGYLNTTLYFALIVASAARAARMDRRLLASYATLIPWLTLATILSLYQLNDDDPLFEG